MDTLREIDHTGDLGIVVEAGTLHALFALAARGLFGLLTDLDAVRPAEARTLRLEAGDRDALLVAWLTDLNYLHVTEGWLFCRFDVVELTDTRLVATALGERYDPARHALHTEIKAVTWHDLHIRRADGRFHVQVIFDM